VDEIGFRGRGYIGGARGRYRGIGEDFVVFRGRGGDIGYRGGGGEYGNRGRGRRLGNLGRGEDLANRGRGL
jgi:hypothetical protein